MTSLVPIAMFGWIPVVLALCAVLPPRRAVVVAFIVAWSFLPMVTYDLRGLPDYTKMSATCGGVLLATAFFDIDRIIRFRPALIDLPMIVWCLCPAASSLSNQLGLYDGFSAAFEQTVKWGFPYFIGRLYLSDLRGLRDLAVGIFYGGLVYIPFCLYEIRMSPQLHHLLYGFHQHDFTQTMRFGGWRPMVFMEHGLMVGMWMSMSALIGIWLWWTGAVRRITGVPVILFVIPLLVTAVLCKSMGALILLGLGLAALASIKALGTRLVAWVLIAAAPAYVALRVSKSWDGTQVREMAATVSTERAQSLRFRLYNEDLLVTKAMQQPVFGWGGWGRNRVTDAKGVAITVIDGQWINVLGLYGFVGLGSFGAVLLLPPVLLLRRVAVGQWGNPVFATAGALVMVNILYMIDNIANAMVNPVYMLAAGALAGVLVYKPRQAAARRRLPARAISRVDFPTAPLLAAGHGDASAPL